MNTHCVVYRTGGTENYQWQRSLAMSEDAARKAVEDTRRMGYAALMLPYAGALPTKYEGQ